MVSEAAPGSSVRRSRARHASHEFLRLERLDHVVVGAGLEADDDVDGVGLGGEHDDGDVGLGPDLTADRDPVLSREHHIQQDDVGPRRAERGECVVAVGAEDRFQPFAAENDAEHLGQGGVVVDDQHSRLHGPHRGIYAPVSDAVGTWRLVADRRGVRGDAGIGPQPAASRLRERPNPVILDRRDAPGAAREPSDQRRIDMSGTPPPDGSPYGDPAQYPPAQYPPQQPQYPTQYPPQQPHPQASYPAPPYQPGWPPGYPVVPELPKPGSMPIGPNDLGKTFGSTFGTLRALWKPVLVAVAPIVVLTAILVGILGIAIARLAPTIGARMDGVNSVGDFIRAVPHVVALTTAGSFGYVVIAICALAVIVGTARAAGRAIAGDRVPAMFIVGSAARALPRVLTWVGVCAVVVVVFAGLGLLAFLASNEASQRIAYFSIVALVAGLVGFAAEVVFVLKLEFLVPAMMLEPRTADPSTGVVTAGRSRPLGLIHAARRSWKLTTGRAWRTFGITLLIGLLAGLAPGIISEILNVGVSLTTVAIGGRAVYVVAYTIYFTVVVGLYQVAVMVQTISQTVLYTDARIRDEGIAPAILDHAATGSPADPWVRWHERY